MIKFTAQALSMIKQTQNNEQEMYLFIQYAVETVHLLLHRHLEAHELATFHQKPQGAGRGLPMTGGGWVRNDRIPMLKTTREHPPPSERHPARSTERDQRRGHRPLAPVQREERTNH